MRVSADVDERTLREIYLPAFERVVTQAQPWTVMCSYNRVNGTYASAAPVAAHRGAARRVGLRRRASSRTGAPCTTGSRRSPPGSTWRCRRSSAGATPRSSPRCASGRRSTRPCSTGPSRRVLALVGRATASRTRRQPSTTTAHHALAREAARDCAVLLKNDGALLPARPHRRPDRRRDRRVRPHPALPGRRQLAGEPDPRRRRRSTSCGPPYRTGCEVTFAPGFGIDGPSTDGDAGSPTRPSRPPRTPTWSCCSSACPDADESEGFDRVAHGPARRAARPAAPGRGRQRPRRGGARQRLGRAHVAAGSTTPARSWSAGCPARRPGERSPTCCSASRTRAAGSPRPSRCGSRTPPPTSTSPATPATCATARASSSATAATTPATQAVSYPFGHGLSYTTFAYDDLTVEVAGSHAAGDLPSRRHLPGHQHR